MDREHAADQAADLIQAVWRVRDEWRSQRDPLILDLTRDLDRLMDDLARLEVLLLHGAQAPGPAEGH